MFDLLLGALEENLGRLLQLSQSIQVATANMEKCVAGTGGTTENYGIDDGGQNIHSSSLNGDDPLGVESRVSETKILLGDNVCLRLTYR